MDVGGKGGVKGAQRVGEGVQGGSIRVYRGLFIELWKSLWGGSRGVYGSLRGSIGGL